MLCSIELCAAAISFGRSNGIPVVVDIRDLWPDSYIDLFLNVSHFRPFLLWLIRLLHFRLVIASNMQRLLQGSRHLF